MSRLVHCAKLNIETKGLDYPPYPGELGKKIYQEISEQAWQLWLNHQTMLINEYRLNLMDAQAREMLVGEMQKFLFGDGSAKPAGYVAPEKV